MTRTDDSQPPANRGADARSDLRDQATALEAELARNRERLTAIRSRVAVVEERAMTAIRAGHDRASRDVLLELQAELEDAAAIEADIHVLTAILAECHTYLDPVDSTGPTITQRAPPA